MSYAAAQQKRGFEVESTYGTPATPARWAGIVVDSPDNSERTWQQSRAAGALEADINIGVEYSFKGSIDTMPQDGQWFRTMFNSRAVSSPAAGGSSVTTFDWNDGSGSQPSFTWEIANIGSPAVVRRYAGAKHTKLSLTNDNRNVLHFNMDWIAQSVIASGATTGTYAPSTSQPYLYNNGAITIGNPTGSVLATVSNVTVNINTGLEEQYFIKSGASPLVTQLDETSRIYDGEVQVAFENIDMYRRFLGNVGAGSAQQTGSEFNLEFIWAKSATDKIAVVVSGCVFKGAPIEGGAEGVLKQTLQWQGRDLNVLITTASGTTPV